MAGIVIFPSNLELQSTHSGLDDSPILANWTSSFPFFRNVWLILNLFKIIQKLSYLRQAVKHWAADVAFSGLISVCTVFQSSRHGLLAMSGLRWSFYDPTFNVQFFGIGDVHRPGRSSFICTKPLMYKMYFFNGFRWIIEISRWNRTR